MTPITLQDIQALCNRALAYSFSLKKLLFVCSVLALCGVMAVFCRALALYADDWVLMSLTFLPIFLCGGVLLAAGVVVIRIYHDEIKKRTVSYTSILSKSWQIVLGAFYFFVPIILVYLLMWMVLGVFFLLRELPGVGTFFGIFLAAGPFLINVGSILLCVLSVALLFFVTPTLALKSVDPIDVSQTIVKRVTTDLFTNGILILMSVMPLLFSLILLIIAAVMTGTTYIDVNDPLHVVLQWFFIMIPFSALLSPAVVFFFNFATEAHVFMRKRMQEATT